MFVIETFVFGLAIIDLFFAFLDLILWIVIFTVFGCFLRSKIAHLDPIAFAAEKRSINMQNFFIVLSLILFFTAYGILVFYQE